MWNEPGRSDIQHYEVEYQFGRVEAKITTPERSFKLDSLQPGTHVRFKITAVFPCKKGRKSKQITARTSECSQFVM